MTNTADAAIFAGIRTYSRSCLDRFEQLQGLEGMPAVLIVVKSLQAGQPVEIQVHENCQILNPGPSYYQLPAPRKR